MERSAIRGGAARERTRISLRSIRATGTNMLFLRIAVTFAALIPFAASAQDSLKISVGARGAFDNQVSEVGQQQGFFKKHGLTLEVLYTQGGGETLTTVI